jgi:hypothetical protein
MARTVSKVDVWAATIEDQPGGVSEKLAPLAKAGANLEFVIARRSPDKPGKGVVFLTPLKGAAQLKAARQAGFQKSTSLQSVRVEGLDKPGVGAELTRKLADAGINLRGLSAAVIGKKSVVYLAFDKPDDATKAMRILR